LKFQAIAEKTAKNLRGDFIAAPCRPPSTLHSTTYWIIHFCRLLFRDTSLILGVQRLNVAFFVVGISVTGFSFVTSTVVVPSDLVTRQTSLFDRFCIK